MPVTAPTEPARRWGLGDAVAGFLLAQVVASVVIQVAWGRLLPTGTALGAGFAGLAEGRPMTRSAGAPLLALIVAQMPLWSVLAGTVVVAGQVRGRGVVGDFGLRLRPLDVPLGLAAGVAAQGAVLVGYTAWSALGGDLDVDVRARQLAAKAGSPGAFLALVLLLGIVGPIVEELFYRGLVLRSLERRISRIVALVVSAVIFAAIHVQAVELPGLVLAGLVFGWLAQRTGRLGPALAAHIGFNLTTLVLLA